MNRQNLYEMLADVFEVSPEEIAPTASLFDFPVYDSVCALTLMARLEDDAQVSCPPNELANLKTILDIEQLVARHGKLDA